MGSDVSKEVLPSDGSTEFLTEKTGFLDVDKPVFPEWGRPSPLQLWGRICSVFTRGDQHLTRQIANPTLSFGFLTVVEIPSLGHCGGLLVVSQIGRPIEFHCTAPVGSNRAQEIMYGKTYRGFLFSDQIGMALVDKTKHQPTVYVTDRAEMLPITELMDAPLIFAETGVEPEPFDGRGLKSFEINNQAIYFSNAQPSQFDIIRQGTESFARRLPLDEPFERIRQAIEEAHSVFRAA